MKLKKSLKGRTRYTIYGALFGALFPLGAYLALTFISRNVNFLFGIICSAPFFLGLFARFAGVRQDRLDEINRGLKELVEQRTRSIKSLLDVSGQGFLSFDRTSLVRPEYSRECENIFGKAVSGEPIDELLYADPKARLDFKSGLELYFNGTSHPQVIFDLLDHEIAIGSKTVSVEYKEIDADNVMAILTDITEARRLQETVRMENERRNMLLKVIANKRAFDSFNRQAETLLSPSQFTQIDYSGYLRDLHTLKGEAGFFGFSATQTAAHEMESRISDSLALEQEVDPAAESKCLREAFFRERAVIRDTLGDEWIGGVEMVEIPRQEYMKLESYVREHYPSDTVFLETLVGQRMKPLSTLFARFPQIVQDMAARMGKRVAPVTITGGRILVLIDEFDSLVTCFTHILRNLVDHGIEPPGERQDRGKKPEGEIHIDILDAPREIVFTFSDDGRGICLPEVEKRGRELGIIKPDEGLSPRELANLILHGNFSTSTSVSLTSGRGVGLSAVCTEARKMGGEVTVKSDEGHGTTFTVTIPRRRQGEAAS